MCEVLASLFAVAVTHCVDDVIAVEPEDLVHSGRESWLALAAAAGWAVSLEKSPPPERVFGVIGITLDLSPVPEHDALVDVTAKRLESVSRAIRLILERGRLSSGEAASLSGKLGFTISATFGRVGRSRIRPIIRRAYSKITRLPRNLHCCLLWWLRYLRTYLPRPIPASLEAMPTILSYSDGEGNTAGVGVAAWVPWLQYPVAAFAFVPDSIRTLWGQMAGVEGYSDIFLIEAVGPLLLMVAFPKVLRNCLWIHFIDNTAAEAALISGSSALDAADHVAGLTWEYISKRRLWPYFDRVESKANPVDGLSRGISDGPWRGVKKVRFPSEELQELAAECGGWHKGA